MNRYITINIIACLLLVGCSDNYSNEAGYRPSLTPRYLQVSPTTLSYTSQASSQSIEITSALTPWIVDNNIDWISTDPSSWTSAQYDEVNVTVTENTSADAARTGIFYVKSDVSDWEYEAPISVTQKAATPTISLSEETVYLPGTASTVTVNVTANCTWYASTGSSWLTVDKNDAAITLNATSNTTNSDRTAKVYIYNGNSNVDVTKVVTVRQLPASITASTESLVFGNTASSADITITAEAAWTATTSSSWVDIEPSSGTAGASTMKISVSPNTSTSERQANVILSVGSDQRIQIPILQRGIYIEAEQSELAFVAAGGTQSLYVQSNTDWIVSSTSSWITVSPDKGNGAGTVKVTAAENPNTGSRVGVIHLTQTGLDIDVAVTVTQEGKTFDVDATQLVFDDKQSTQTINIETDGTWQATTTNSWITVSPSTASGNSTLSVSVSENTSDEDRIGNVTVTMADRTINIVVGQIGKYFTVSNDLLTYSSKGGTIDVSISTNDSWTAKIEDGSTWLALSETKGHGAVNVKVVATDNPSVNSRTAALVFETAHNQSVKIMVTQNARYLDVDTRDILFYSKGGTSEVFTISTDCTYKITCSDTWFTVSQSNNTFTVVATENTSSEPRTGTITIESTDLKEGSYKLTLSVTQLNKGGSFMRKDYDDDQNWDGQDNTSGTLTITSFGSDVNWDSNGSSSVKLNITGYGEETNRQ